MLSLPSACPASTKLHVKAIVLCKLDMLVHANSLSVLGKADDHKVERIFQHSVSLEPSAIHKVLPLKGGG